MLILAAAVMVSLVLLDVFYLGDLRALAHGLAAGASLSFRRSFSHPACWRASSFASSSIPFPAPCLRWWLR